jgi:hypothetical protein
MIVSHMVGDKLIATLPERLPAPGFWVRENIPGNMLVLIG